MSFRSSRAVLVSNLFRMCFTLFAVACSLIVPERCLSLEPFLSIDSPVLTRITFRLSSLETYSVGVIPSSKSARAEREQNHHPAEHPKIG